MTQEDLNQLATRQDLQELKKTLFEELKEVIKDALNPEFLTPKDFADKVAMSYTNVIRLCKIGKIEATQETANGSWMIHRDEVKRLVQQAKDNTLWNR